MKSTIEYIAQLLNIKTESELVVMDMASELSQVDTNEFVMFIKQNFNYAGLEYQTGFQKFMSLVKIYKRQKTLSDNSDKIEEALSFAQNACLKVKSVSSEIIFNPSLDFANFVDSDTKEPYFTDLEVSALSKIGNLAKCVNLQKSVSGTDMLLEEIEKRIENKYSNNDKPLQISGDIKKMLGAKKL